MPTQGYEQIWKELEALGGAHGLKALAGKLYEGVGQSEGTRVGLSTPSNLQDGEPTSQLQAGGDVKVDVQHKWRRHGRFYGLVHGHR